MGYGILKLFSSLLFEIGVFSPNDLIMLGGYVVVRAKFDFWYYKWFFNISYSFIIFAVCSFFAVKSYSSLFILSWSRFTPTWVAAFSTEPGGRFKSKFSGKLIPLAYANTIDLAIFSLSVLFPPLCLILICRFNEPSEP